MNGIHIAKQIVYGSENTLMFTYQQSIKFKDIDAVYCETGVAAGANIIALCSGAPDKKVYAFDSFFGIPWPSNRDDQMPGIRMLEKWEQKSLPDPGKQILETTGATSVSLEDFWVNIEKAKVNKNNIVAVLGWFEDTMPIYGPLIEPISILRLDGDLYNSTWVCLQHLFPKVIKGGCVIVDDWTLQGCQAACKEYFELIDYTPDYKYLDGTAYFFK